MGLAWYGHALKASFFEDNRVYNWSSFLAFPIITTSISHHKKHLRYHLLKFINSFLNYQQWPLSLKSPTAYNSLSPSRASIKLQLCQWHRMLSSRPLIFHRPIFSPQTSSRLATMATMGCIATTTTTNLATGTLSGTVALAVMVLLVPGTPAAKSVVTPTAVLAPLRRPLELFRLAASSNHATVWVKSRESPVEHTSLTREDDSAPLPLRRHVLSNYLCLRISYGCTTPPSSFYKFSFVGVRTAFNPMIPLSLFCQLDSWIPFAYTYLPVLFDRYHFCIDSKRALLGAYGSWVIDRLSFHHR